MSPIFCQKISNTVEKVFPRLHEFDVSNSDAGLLSNLIELNHIKSFKKTVVPYLLSYFFVEVIRMNKVHCI